MHVTDAIAAGRRRMPYLKMTAVTLAMACCMSDLFYGKIYNLFWLAGSFCGIVENLLLAGRRGAGLSLAGFALPLVAGAGLFYFRMTGAGDLKELSAAGAIVGARMVMKIGTCSFLFGAGIAGVLCLMDTDLKERLRYLFGWMTRRIAGHEKLPYRQESRRGDHLRDQRGLPLECFHFSVPVFMAVLFYAGGYLD